LTSKQEVLAFEERWSRPAGSAALAAIVLVVVSQIVGLGIGGNSGTAEQLVEVDKHAGAEIISSILLALGFALLAGPLYFLFRAARARSDRVRRQLVGVVIAGPLFFAAAFVVVGFVTVDGSESFVENKLPALEREHVKLDSDKADEKAEDTLSERALAGLGTGLKFAGLLGLIVGMAYTALWAMRVGLLTRFWGSLGIALAVVSVLGIFLYFTLLWFVYLGLLFLGRVPGGRPPAWLSGEAAPWPTPGEKAAAEMQPPPGIPGGEASPGEEASQSEDSRPSEGEALDGDDAPEGPSGEATPPRKRKRRG
jgi:hypothetical protein